MGENFGHAVFEALIAGLPVLLSDRIPFYSEIEKFGAGFMFPLENQELFVSQLTQLVMCDSKDLLDIKDKVYKYVLYLDNRINQIDKYVKMLG